MLIRRAGSLIGIVLVSLVIGGSLWLLLQTAPASTMSAGQALATALPLSPTLEENTAEPTIPVPPPTSMPPEQALLELAPAAKATTLCPKL